MTVLKIISLLAVLSLGFIEFRRESAKIKWAGVTLCISIFAVGVADLLVSDREKKEFEHSVKRDATRIDWGKSKATLRIMNEIDEVLPRSQQVVIKIMPADLTMIGGVALKNILNRTVSYDHTQNYLSESDANSLWNALAEEDGSIRFSEEAKFGVEHITFYEEHLEKAPFQGTISSMRVSYEPRAGSIYGSLHDLNNTILIARFVAGVSGPAILDRVTLDLRTRAGLSTLTFPAKQLKNDSLVTNSVRYVGMVLGKDEF